MSPLRAARAPKGLGPRILGVTLVVAVLVGLIVTGLTVAVGHLRDAGAEASQAERTVAIANRLERTVIDLETGQRGYLITRDRQFLAPYDAARRALPGLLSWLRGASTTPAQQRRATALADRIDFYERRIAVPTVALGERDLAAARRKVATGEGKRRVDAIRRGFDAYVAAERTSADRTRSEADHDGGWARTLGIVGAIVSALLVVLFGLYLLRAVVLPVRRLADGVRRVEGGDLQVEVLEVGGGEVGDLARGFNAMGRALQEHHDELEGQTAEVEAQRDDLERTFAELEDEKAWVETLFGFVERLVAESDLDAVADIALRQAVTQVRGDAGVLWVVDDEGELARRATVGVAPERLPTTMEPTTGVAGRAAKERRPIRLAHADTGLEVEGLAGPDRPARVSHELHVPLHRGGDLLGIVSVGRVADRPFSADEVERVRGLAEQTVVAVAKAVEEARVTRLAAVNAAVLDATSFGVVMYDVQGRMTVANRRMREMWTTMGMADEATPEERAARMLELSTDPETDGPELARFGEDWTHTFRMELHVAETGHWFVGRTDAVSDAHGTLIGRIVSFRDSTQEHEIQRMRDEFVATVTHELRTPLSSVVAAVDLLEDETEEPTPGQSHWTGMIRRNVDRLLRLVDDLLTVARAESGQFTLHPGACDLAVVATDAVESARAGADAKGVAIELVVAPAPLRADVTRVAQAVDNLLANAVKFTPAGGRVRVRVAVRGETIVLDVADSGIGIPLADRARLFERFYRAPAATDGAVPGTGLGLTITKAIVEAHGGAIRVEDGLDSGTTFVVELPQAGPQDAGAADPA